MTTTYTAPTAPRDATFDSAVRLHRTFGLSTSSAELVTLNGDRVADAPSWAGHDTAELAREWARRAVPLGMRLVRGEPRVVDAGSSAARWVIESWTGGTVELGLVDPRRAAT